MLGFLHGFLGQKEDWQPLLKYLPSSFSICNLDLPGHASAEIETDIVLAIRKQLPSAKLVVGYSAGGRIALELKARFPKDYEKVIAISSHPGLKSEEEKKRRWELDLQWIELLQKSSFEEFLEKWYNQDLFQNLKNSPQFAEILKRRKMQNPQAMAHFLSNYSLSKKDILPIDPSTIFLHGKEDLKYGKLYRTLNTIEKIFTIENAGHAVHLENPKACADIILGAINDYY